MKRTLTLIITLLSSLAWMSATADVSPQEKYIARYASIAVSEMYRTGVPASITLAQGLLESRYGQSPLATKGNNHFGIKCHEWKGKIMSHDDDKRGECFRVYDSAEESFSDHSDFLRYRDRYKSLFENKTTDYKAWAYGLKRAGYATDPAYPSKLIKLIEDYRLYQYDTMKPSELPAGAETLADAADAKTPVAKAEQETKEKSATSRKESRKERKRRLKAAASAGAQPAAEPAQAVEIPAAPLQLEEPVLYKGGGEARESFTFSLSRKTYSTNGVPFIYSAEGETLSSIAKDNELFMREILKYNDLKSDQALAPGTVVYLKQKKAQAAKGVDGYVVDHDGESLRDIAQRFGVRLDSILKMNGISAAHQTREGDMIILRPRR